MVGFKQTATVALLALGISFTGISNAALFDRGGGMIYDSTQNITWASNANLFQTQVFNNSNLVSQILDASGSHFNDSANYYNGKYNLRSSDFNTNSGQMTWQGAQAWVHSLTLGGFTDWRLPITVDGDGPYNQTDSEMGHLFYIDLGVTALNSITSSTNGNLALFSNTQASAYWSSTEVAPGADGPGAWAFGTNQGTQGSYADYNQFYAWAVRSGDVTTVPLPGTVWLFGTALCLFSFIRNKNKNT